MRDTSPLRARKEPTQDRSRDLVAAVRQAAARILRDGGVDALNTATLCEVAGVSPGSLYQYFPSKEAVLYALLRDHAERLTRALTQVLVDHHAAAPSVLVAAAVDEMIAEHLRDPMVHSAVGHLIATEAGPGLENDLMSQAESALVQVLESRSAELGGRDPEVTAFLLIRTLEGVVHAATRDAPELLEREAFRDGLVAMLLATLGPSKHL